jgi:hypothetical protein
VGDQSHNRLTLAVGYADELEDMFVGEVRAWRPASPPRACPPCLHARASKTAPMLLPLPLREGGVRVYRGAALPLTLTLSPVGEREIGRARFAPSSNEG